MTRLVIEFRGEDEDAAEIITAVNQFAPYTIERAEMEAHLFMVLARVAWREADMLRAAQRRAANRRPRKKT